MMRSFQTNNKNGYTQIFEFVSSPPPVYVRTAGDTLKDLGITPSFELHTINGIQVRYLSLEDIRKFMREATKPCRIDFVQSKDAKLLDEIREAQAAASVSTGAAAFGAVLAVMLF